MPDEPASEVPGDRRRREALLVYPIDGDTKAPETADHPEAAVMQWIRSHLQDERRDAGVECKRVDDHAPSVCLSAFPSFLISAKKGYGDCRLDAYGLLRIRLVPPQVPRPTRTCNASPGSLPVPVDLSSSGVLMPHPSAIDIAMGARDHTACR